MEAGLINMTFKFIDYKKEFYNGNPEAVDSKWVSFDTFDGRHVEGIAYFDDRSNIRVHGYNGIVIANQGGTVMVPSADVFADSIRFIEPFTVPRIVLMDNTSITCQIDNPKPNGSYVQVVLLNGRRIKIHGMSIKYIEEPFSVNNNANTTASNANNTTAVNNAAAKPTRIIENHTSSTDTTADTVNTTASTATVNTASTTTNTNNSKAIPPTLNNVNNANTAHANDDSHMKPNAHTANAAHTVSNVNNNGAQQFTNNNQVNNTTVNANNANNTASTVPIVALNTDNDADDSVSFDDDYDDLDDDSELDTNTDTDSELDTYVDNDDSELDTDDDSDSELDDTYDDSDSDYDYESDDFNDDDTNANNANTSTNTTSSMSDDNHTRMRLPIHRLNNNASSLSNIRKPVNRLEESSSIPMVNHDLNEMLTSDDYDDDTMNEPGADDSDNYWDDNDTILDLDTDDDNNNGMNII